MLTEIDFHFPFPHRYFRIFPFPSAVTASLETSCFVGVIGILIIDASSNSPRVSSTTTSISKRQNREGIHTATPPQNDYGTIDEFVFPCSSVSFGSINVQTLPITAQPPTLRHFLRTNVWRRLPGIDPDFFFIYEPRTVPSRFFKRWRRFNPPAQVKNDIEQTARYHWTTRKPPTRRKSKKLRKTKTEGICFFSPWFHLSRWWWWKLRML